MGVPCFSSAGVCSPIVRVRHDVQVHKPVLAHGEVAFSIQDGLPLLTAAAWKGYLVT